MNQPPTKTFLVVSILSNIRSSLGLMCDRVMIQDSNPNATVCYPLDVRPGSLSVGDALTCFVQKNGRPYLSYLSPFCLLDSRGEGAAVAEAAKEPSPEPRGTRLIIHSIHKPAADASTTTAVARHTATHSIHTLVVPAEWYDDKSKLGANIKAVRTGDEWTATS